MKKISWLIGAFILTGSTVSADKMTASYLYEKCTSKSEMERGFCLGYIAGVNGGILFRDNFVCKPEGITFGQEYKIAMKWIKDHPEFLHQHALFVVARSVQEAFPCKLATKNKFTID